VRRPLVVINGPILQSGGRRLITRHTGGMLAEVASRLGPLDLLQFLAAAQDAGLAGGLFDFDVASHPRLAAHGIQAPVGDALERLMPRIHMYGRIPLAVAGRPWCYLFLPGTLPAFTAATCRLARVPYAVYVRGVVPDDVWHRSAIRKARLVVCNNAHDAERAQALSRRVAVAKALTELVPADLEVPRETRPHPRRLLFVGRLEAAKGVDVLLEAFQRVAARDPKLELVLVGDGPLAVLARRLDPTGARIRLTGVIQDRLALRQEYLEADLFVLPTLAEGFPRVLYEAMTYRLPVVTTLVGGIPSVMRDGWNCLGVPAGDADRLERALRTLLEDGDLRTALVAGGTETARHWLSHQPPSHADLLAEAFATGGSPHE